MKCSLCSQENPADSAFCEGCGHNLESSCPSCGTSINPDAKYCRKCGLKVTTPAEPRNPGTYTPKHLADKILQSRSALEGERKQVTVLFADVKGSMELAEQLDPEEWHRILEGFFAILTEGVHRFEGTVNQYTGDGIMALFGAPIAHEDHARRACYAALHLRDTLRTYADELRVTHGLNFGFRIGMNSGEVVVGKIGDDLRMDYTAQGHSVGLAQRMEALADSRSIVLSANTARFVDGYFALRDLGQMRIKGVADEQHVFELEGLGTHRTRLDTSRARGLSRFVGRGDEMGTLESALQRSLEGTGRVAAVVGEPGVGKSRLCAEFIDHCRAQGLRVFEAHCPAHGKAIPYLPLLELLRNLFGVTDQDGVREARQKIAGELALLDDAFADDRAMVLDFLGVADPKMPLLQLEPTVRQRRLFAFLRRLIQRRTEAEPIVILIDDLHWIDPGSDLFVAQIVEAVSSTRTLLLVNFRPEYTADWTRKSWVLQLPMAPLSAEALAELVRDWVGARASVAKLPAMIGARSGGNPFFAEEIVLSLLDTGKLVGTRGHYELNATIESLDVPATVQSLLASRIDRLGEREKQVLYTAAVIGKEFARPLLEAVLDLSTDDLDAALSALLNAEMINERSLYPVAEYSFKHPLTHEVALRAQLGSARRGRHAQVATAIEASSPDQLDERAGLLAHHWQEAGEPLQAARWHVRAARWVRANDLSAAHRHWAQARELLLPLPDAPQRTQLLLAVYPELINLLDRLGAEPSVAEAIYTEGITFTRHSGSRVTEALLEAVYGYLLTATGEWARVLECGMRAVALAEQEGDVAVAVFGRFVTGRAHGWSGRPRELLAVLDPVALLFDGDEGWDLEVLGWPVYAEALSIRSNAHALLGQPLVSRAFTDRLSAQLRRPGHAQDLTSAACDRIYAAFILGDVDAARRDAAETLVLAERFGSPRNTAYALLVCGMASSMAARWDDGESFLLRAEQLINNSGAGREWQAKVRIYRALCLAHLGEHSRSVALARQVASDELTPFDMSDLFQAARALRVAGAETHAVEIGALIARSVSAMERAQFVGLLPMALLERAALAQLQGDAVSMQRDLAEARRLLASMGSTGWDAYARSIEA